VIEDKIASPSADHNSTLWPGSPYPHVSIEACGEMLMLLYPKGFTNSASQYRIAPLATLMNVWFTFASSLRCVDSLTKLTNAVPGNTASNSRHKLPRWSSVIIARGWAEHSHHIHLKHFHLRLIAPCYNVKQHQTSRSPSRARRRLKVLRQLA
jgi:hypothetical protein